MTTQKKSLLIVQHLSLAFGSITAVDDLSFVAPEDQITALVGPEGAGKTSVLNCVTGLCRPLTGRIELHGGRRAPFLLERMEHCRIARNAHVVRTFRNARLFASMTVLDNIVVAQNGRFGTGKVISSVFGFPSRRRALEKARHWLDRVGLSREGARVAAELSPALRRRDRTEDPRIMLIVHCLTAGYGRSTVLQRVSFTAEDASITAILGAGGAGKTTLANAVCGFLPVWAGQVIYGGEDITNCARHD